MKKFITLLMTAMVVSGAFAQSADTREARRILSGGSSRSYPTNDGRVYDNRGNYPTNRSGSADGINREYDEKIRSIRNNRNLSNAEKDRIIRDLESQRQRRLQEVRGDNNRRYDDRRNNNRRYDRNDKQYAKKHKNKGPKGNNGKHLGWQKGKGNPHRYD